MRRDDDLTKRRTFYPTRYRVVWQSVAGLMFGDFYDLDVARREARSVDGYVLAVWDRTDGRIDTEVVR